MEECEEYFIEVMLLWIYITIPSKVDTVIPNYRIKECLIPEVGS